MTENMQAEKKVAAKKGLVTGTWAGIVIGAALLAGVGGFFGGMQYQKSQASSGTFSNFQNMTSAQRQAFRQQNGGNFPGNRGGVSGSIISKDDKSLTVKLSDGSTRVVYYSGSTTVSTQTSASTNDLAVGKNVQVGGTPNTDNSTTATRIIILP